MAFVQLPAIDAGPLEPEFASGLLKPGHGEVGCHESAALAGTGIQAVQYLLFARQRLRRRHQVVVAVGAFRLAGNEVAVPDQFTDPRDHGLTLEALDLEAECARQDGMG